MSLYKRGKIYWCEWKVGGQRVRETTGTEDIKQAQEYHDLRRAEIWREARLDDKPLITWDEAALEWVDEHAIYKRSFDMDQSRLKWLTKELSGKPLKIISTDALLSIRKKLQKEGKSGATVNRYMAVVSAVINYAHSKGKIEGVPKIPYMRESKDEFNWLTHEQANALISQLPPHLASISRFALATGLRRSNITDLMWKNIDMSRHIAWVWADSAKAGKNIAVPLNDDALTVLNEQMAINKSVTPPSPYVFTYKNNPVFRTTTQAWKKAIVRAGIDPDFTFHDLRHTWASWHVQSGTPLQALKELGGWASMDMVLRYAHLSGSYVASYAGNSNRKKEDAKAEDAIVSDSPDVDVW